MVEKSEHSKQSFSLQVDKQIKHLQYLNRCLQQNIQYLRLQASKGLERRIADLIDMTVTCTNVLQTDSLWPNSQLEEYSEKGFHFIFGHIFSDIFGLGFQHLSHFPHHRLLTMILLISIDREALLLHHKFSNNRNLNHIRALEDIVETSMLLLLVSLWLEHFPKSFCFFQTSAAILKLMIMQKIRNFG